MRYRVSIEEHQALPWRVHALVGDFKVEDVWRFPVRLSPEHELATFREHMAPGMSAMNRLNPARVLLALRLSLGRLFGWDRLPEGRKGRVLRARYAAEENLEAGEPATSGSEFTEVYDLGNEHLSEIENRTVQAALHLGRVPIGEEAFAVNLAIYVKPRGLFGRLYMSFIRPFRLWIVYPAILRAAGRRWAEYLAESAP